MTERTEAHDEQHRFVAKAHDEQHRFVAKAHDELMAVRRGYPVNQGLGSHDERIPRRGGSVLGAIAVGELDKVDVNDGLVCAERVRVGAWKA